MKLTKSKYALLAFVVGIAACNNEYQDFEDVTPPQTPVAASFSKEFSVTVEGQAGLSKAYQDGAYLYLHTGDEMSVFSGAANSKFVNAYNGVFQGNAADADKYYALFPYQEGATIADGVISATISAVQTTDTANTKNWDKATWFNNALLSVGVTSDKEKSFALKNVGAAIQFRISVDKPVEKVEITATKNIAGPVKISIGDDGTPTAEGGDSKTITINNPLVKWNNNYVSTLPVGETDLEVKYYRDGKVCGTRKYEKVNLSRNALANIGYLNYHKASFVTGVEGETIENVDFEETSSIQLPSIGNITNGNKQFVGWRAPNDTVYAADTWFYREAYTYGDMTFTAEWTDGFVLKYEGVDCPPVVFKAGDEIALADFPKSAGYKYTAWNVNGEKKQPGDKIKPKGNISVSAEYEYIPFQVTIDAQGGKFEDGSDKFVIDFRNCDYMNFEQWNSEQQKYQFRVVRMWGEESEYIGSRPTRDGYVFRYYYAASNENSSMYSLYYPVSDTTFYAKWEKKYTIEYYNGNGDRMWKDEDNYYTDGNTTIWITSNYYSENNEDIKGKVLVGWKDQDGNVYEPGKYFPISALTELKDLKFSPVFESTDQASSHEGWTTKPF